MYKRQVCEGATPSFTVAASGTGITYQWQVDLGSGYINVSNSGAFSGATAGTLSINPASTSMNGYQFRCVVSGSCTPSVTSSTASLTVNSLPTIVGQPNNTTMSACALAGTASCTTAATGTGISYQWQENTGSGWNNLGVNPVIFAGSGVITFINPPASMNGYQYRCIVSLSLIHI